MKIILIFVASERTVVHYSPVLRLNLWWSIHYQAVLIVDILDESIIIFMGKAKIIDEGSTTISF